MELNHFIFAMLLIFIENKLLKLEGATLTTSNISEKDILRNELYLITSNMNNSVSPCEDFFTYSCGNFKRITAMDYEDFSAYWDGILDMIFSQDDQLLSNSERKVKRYYVSCKKSTIADLFTKFSDMKNLSWPETESIKEKNFDWIKLIAKLNAMNVKSVFLDFSSEPNLRISLAPISIDVDLTYNLMVKRGVPMKVANESVQELKDFIGQLHFTDVLSSLNGIYFADVKIAYLKEQINTFDWDKYFQYVLGLKLDNNQKIRVVNLNSMIGLLKVLSKTNPRILANYILTQSFIDVEANRFCALESVELFNSAVINAVRKYFLKDKNIEKYLESLLYYLQSFEKEKQHYSKEIRKFDNFDLVKSQLEFLLVNYNENMADKELENIRLDENDIYFNSLYDAKINFRKQMFLNKLKSGLKDVAFEAINLLPKFVLHFNKPLIEFFATDIHRRWSQLLEIKFEESPGLEYFTAYDCLQNQMNTSSINQEELLKGILLKISTFDRVHEVFNIYKNYSSEVKDFEEIYNEFHLNIDKIFLLEYVQTLCPKGEQFVNAVFSNIPEMAGIFECPLGTAMNSGEQKCTSWRYN